MHPGSSGTSATNLQNHGPDLFDLVRLRVRAGPLQINFFFNATLQELVMAAPHASLETQTVEQLAQTVKPDGRIDGIDADGTHLPVDFSG